MLDALLTDPAGLFWSGVTAIVLAEAAIVLAGAAVAAGHVAGSLVHRRRV